MVISTVLNLYTRGFTNILMHLTAKTHTPLHVKYFLPNRSPLGIEKSYMSGCCVGLETRPLLDLLGVSENGWIGQRI